MLSIVIIDDEVKARDAIRNILKISLTEVGILGEAGSVSDGFDLINRTNPNLVLLDINLPDGTGFDLLKKFQTFSFRLIFITAYEEYAVKAFKFSALDYILKPFEAGELLRAIDKARETIENDKTELKFKTFLSNLDKLKKVVLRTTDSIHIVHLSEIIRLESDVNYTFFSLSTERNLWFRKR